jgi:ubiquitin carboxyl-terminal hydrolase 7
VQHDIQEFERVLIDNLEIKMKGTPLEGRVPALFRGHFRSDIRCSKINYTSERTEELCDLSMVVKYMSDLNESFARYVEQEILTGENQYDTGEHGKQDAVMGIVFVDFPPVLHLHLRRFEYDHRYDRLCKISDRFEFQETIDCR